ncbi:MAG: PilZ domain-containing protein [Myxococcales bacterium]|nr:PilZ domain-containing protein [Myxococcales bacterium]
MGRGAPPPTARQGAARSRRRARRRGARGALLHAGEKTLTGTIVDLGEGGMRVHLSSDGIGDTVEVELDSDDPKHAQATANVRWKRPQADGIDVGLHFVTQAEPHRRRMRRLILEILRRMPAPS